MQNHYILELVKLNASEFDCSVNPNCSSEFTIARVSLKYALSLLIEESLLPHTWTDNLNKK